MSLRKRIAMLMACLTLCLAATPANAAAALADPVMPRMTYISEIDYSLSIDNDVADVYAYVSGYSNTATKCEVTIELQERTLLFFWDTVETWYGEATGRVVELAGMKIVTPGNTYRIVVTGTVWSGTESETQSVTSDTVQAS